MTLSVLFMCDHAAGKSLLAATYFRAAAGRSGLDVAIDVAGPDPDPEPMPTVVDALTRQGHRVDFLPKLVTPDIAGAADLVVTVGCSPQAVPSDCRTRIDQWDVPMLSRDFDDAMRQIHYRAEHLARALAAATVAGEPI